LRVRENSIVMIPRWSLEMDKDLQGFLKDLLKLADYQVQYIYFVLRPSVITVDLKGMKRLITIPPAAIIVDNSIPVNIEKFMDLALKYGIKVFRLSEDSWIEVKNILMSNEICVLGYGKINEVVQELNLKSLHNTCIGKASTCLIIDERANIYLKEYVKLLNYKHIAILTSLKDIELRDAEGEILSLWRHHPVLYDLDVWGKKIHVKIAVADNVKEIVLLSKPLAFLNNEVLILEISYNNSILFTATLPFKALLIKALLYVC